jgi:VIT1/CCC1 family predicted Fe2+/Mn2+ transporter
MNINPGINHVVAAFKQAVIGISDGLIITFAVITGFSVIAGNNQTIIQAGYIVLVGGAIIMGVGGYFAAKGRQENFAQKTTEEEAVLKKDELKKTISLFKQLNLSKEMQDLASTEIENDSKEWKAYLKAHLPESERNESSSLLKTAFIIALSFLAGGFISLLPYLFIHEKKDAFFYSTIFTLVFLLFLGFIKSKVNKEPLFLGTVRLILLGVSTATAAYMIASIFAAQ